MFQIKQNVDADPVLWLSALAFFQNILLLFFFIILITLKSSPALHRTTLPPVTTTMFHSGNGTLWIICIYLQVSSFSIRKLHLIQKFPVFCHLIKKFFQYVALRLRLFLEYFSLAWMSLNFCKNGFFVAHNLAVHCSFSMVFQAHLPNFLNCICFFEFWNILLLSYYCCGHQKLYE